MNNNLTVWDQVCETDIAYTKHVNQRGGFTSIDSTYQAMLATKVFGPYGASWGLSETNYDYSMVEPLGLVICNAVFFYELNSKRFSFPISNAIAPQKGRPDVDLFKKIETNTISKALSKLGFSADVFMGKFEDNNYVQEITNSQAIDKANDKEEEVIRQQQELIDYVKRNKTAIAGSASVSMAKGVYSVAVKYLDNKSKILILNGIAHKGVTALNDEYNKYMENQK
jgi:hypothetical protein